MDTRRLSEPIDAGAAPAAPAASSDVEVVELSHVQRPARGYLARLAFVIGVALLAGLIAIAGFPTRQSVPFDQPLPNFFAAPAAR